MSAPGVLGRILERTRDEVAERRRLMPLERLTALARTPQPRRAFGEALARAERLSVIAEFKRQSPSQGPIREDLRPAEVARAYEGGGAAALSVLTERHFFAGSLEDLQQARAATRLPVLRKDFIVDAYQIWEASHAGADAVLLIVAALTDAELKDLSSLAREAGLDVLVEVHDRQELCRALRVDPRIVGVNNRDLKSMQVSLATSFDLARLIPDHVVAVAESGIRTGEDARRLRDAGFDACLVGEHLMRAPDPGEALQALISQTGAGARSPRPGARVLVKVCGITRVDDALAAARAGADAVGMVFWLGSPRHVGVAEARRISAALPPFVLRVGVFVDAPREVLERTADDVGLDLLQLHGKEPPEALESLSRRALKAVSVGEGFAAEDALRYEGRAAGILLDTRGTNGTSGGTGRSFDWSLASEVRARASFLVLAGGLRADNVQAAIESVGPDAVDVSSGVESSPGRKDAEKLRAFIQAVRGAGRRETESVR